MKKKPHIFQIAATPRELIIKIDLSGRTYNPVAQSLVDGIGPTLLSMFDPKAAAPQAVKNNLYEARDELMAGPEHEDKPEEWQNGWKAGTRKAVEAFFDAFDVPYVG